MADEQFAVPRSNAPTPQKTVPQSSLAGFWERGRRLLRLFGQQWDERVQPVMIVADSREPCGLPDSYRRFGLAFAGTHALGTCLKIRCDAVNGAVLEDFYFSSTAPATVPFLHLRSLSVASAASDAGVTYNPVGQAFGSLAGAYLDTPDDGQVPFSYATNGVVAAGRIFGQGPFNSSHYGQMRLGIYLPQGAAINLNYAQASANETFWITGYLR